MNRIPVRPLIILLFIGLSACSKPDFTTADGKAGTFSQGKWQIINYWASWCSPCREEIPDLNEFARANPDIQVYAVNYDGLEGEALAAAATEMGIAFPSLSADPAPQLRVPRPQVLPTTLLVDGSGKVVTTLTGPQTLESLGNAIAKAVNRPAD